MIKSYSMCTLRLTFTDDDIEDCGPLDTELPPRWPPETEEPPPESSSVSTTTPVSAVPTAASTWSISSRHNLHRRFLYNTTIGEEYVNCTFSSNSTDRAHGIKRVYEFDQPVYPQCGTMDNNVIMLLTTDFCCKFSLWCNFGLVRPLRHSVQCPSDHLQGFVMTSVGST